MDNLSTDPYGTHRPVLAEIIKTTAGNIIECGCGYSSTYQIRSLIDGTNRKLISLESNLEWFNKFKHLENDNHKLFYVDAGNNDTDDTGNIWIDFIKNNKIICETNFEICFIDQRPWTARTYTLNYFLNKCKLIIVHDVDYFPTNKKWGKIIRRLNTSNNIYKYEMDFSDVATNFIVYYPPDKYFAGRTGPPTLLCSNITTKEEFSNLCNKIDVNKYYTK